MCRKVIVESGFSLSVPPKREKKIKSLKKRRIHKIKLNLHLSQTYTQFKLNVFVKFVVDGHMLRIHLAS